MSISLLSTTRWKLSFTKCSCNDPCDQVAQNGQPTGDKYPYFIHKKCLPSCLSDTVGPVKTAIRHGQDTNMQCYIAWTDLDRVTIRSMSATESGYNCCVSSWLSCLWIFRFYCLLGTSGFDFTFLYSITNCIQRK
jgi:hypothetical protein